MDEVVLREWEIWYTYSTYLESPASLDLEALARAMVEEGAAFCSVHSDGTVCYGAGDTVESTAIAFKEDSGRVTAEFDSEGVSDRDFTAEAALWGARMIHEERRLLGDHPWTPAHVRLFLGRIELRLEGRAVVCYPVVKVYESGVILFELRHISPAPFPVSEFVRRAVNLSARRIS